MYYKACHKVTRISAQLTSVLQSLHKTGFPRYYFLYFDIHGLHLHTNTTVPIVHIAFVLSKLALYHLRRARSHVAGNCLSLTNCFCTIEHFPRVLLVILAEYVKFVTTVWLPAPYYCVRLREPASLHTHHAFTHSTTCTAKCLHKWQAFTHTQLALYYREAFHTETAFTQY